MKLLIAIVNNEDSNKVSSALTREGFTVTKLSTTGGFLMIGNTTFLIGADDERVQDAKDIIKTNSASKEYSANTTDSYGRGLGLGDLQENVPVGGAIVFTIQIEDMDKY